MQLQILQLQANRYLSCMFAFLLLLKGGLIVTALRYLFLMYWNRQIKGIIEGEAIQHGYKLVTITKPGRKKRKTSPFVIDPSHVNDGGDWIYYRVAEVIDHTGKRTKFWLKIILDKEGKYATDWREDNKNTLSAGNQ
jgi:hypothetical protein